ncbi:MAG: carbohydrate ABC transporter permease [Micropruina sp.]|uniref:carbohydrate ABC transporter permease n=1 Tax=Micropruina sp. TaxID=2737536 RepID=UPI0039E6C846
MTAIANQPEAEEDFGPELKPPRPYNLTVTTVLAVGSLVVLVPLYFILAMSLKTGANSDAGAGFAFPFDAAFGNFAAAWEMVNAPVAFTWSVIISAIAVVGNILIPSMFAWAVVRNWDHPLFRYSYVALLAGMFIPFVVLVLPQIKLMAAFKLDNPFGVAILHIMFGLAFNSLMFYAYIRNLPVELEESAALDGATPFTIFRKVVFPLLSPMAATVGIFAFLNSWNDYMMPSLIIADVTMQTLPVVQASYRDALSLNINVAFASYALAMIPAIVGYLIGQRWIIAGVMRGSIK